MSFGNDQAELAPVTLPMYRDTLKTEVVMPNPAYAGLTFERYDVVAKVTDPSDPAYGTIVPLNTSASNGGEIPFALFANPHGDRFYDLTKEQMMIAVWGGGRWDTTKIKNWDPTAAFPANWQIVGNELTILS